MGKYLGRDNPYGIFEKQNISGDGVTTEFDLDFQVGSSSSVLVVLNVDGVTKILEPGWDYTIAGGGKKIVFTDAPIGDNGNPPAERLYVLYLGKQLSVPAVPNRSPLLVQHVGDGATDTFDVSDEVVLTEHGTIVFVNGVQQSFTENFTIVNNEIVLSDVPAIGARVDIYVFGGIERLTLSELTDPILGNKIADGAVTAQKLNLSYNKSFADDIKIETFAGMTNSATIQQAVYQDLGNIVRLKVKLQVTLSGTADNKIRFSLPIDNEEGTNITFTAVISSDTSLESGIVRWGAVNALDIYRQFGVNYTLGTHTIEVSAEYQKQ